ncbi:hypothetical protein D9611_010767 [Ephemerocybe angulata]|uniref:Uncharacterized protein n=1 Tax=Ephemerocybe angulata TaxID=980116 RepID=A0A8H5F1K8_9AGAR|nr:hypothetical protein D9611_010767 [Tulosesus angulatus]
MDGLSMRGESLAVPFQHSLREFLEGAVGVYKRSLGEYEDGILEARVPRPVTVIIEIMDTGTFLPQRTVPSNTVLRELVSPEVVHSLGRPGLPAGGVSFTTVDQHGQRHLRMAKTIDENHLLDPIIFLAARPTDRLLSPPATP